MSYKITVIEDNEPDILLLETALERAGVNCTITALRDGSGARTYIASVVPPDVPDLMLIDLNLPKLDGLALLKLTQESGSLANVPVVIWSSVRSERQVKELTAFPVVRFITKPLDFEEFMLIGETLRAIVEPAGSRPETGIAAVL